MPLTTMERCEVLQNGFSRRKKRAWLAAYNRFFPNMVMACKIARISLKTIEVHRKNDIEFETQVSIIKLDHVAQIENTAVEHAKNADKGFQDRKMVLSAYKPELYGDRPLVAIQQNFGVSLGNGKDV